MTINTKQLIETLQIGLHKKFALLVLGGAGIGKSDIVSQVAKLLGWNLIIFHPVVSDPTDFKGFPAIINGEAVFIPFGELHKLLQANKETICFFDDLGQAPQTVQAAVMQLILARQINGHVISEHVRFVAASNRRKDKAGVGGILKPLINRFTVVEYEPDVDNWIYWAKANNIEGSVIDFVRLRPELFNSYELGNDMENFPSPRGITQMARWVKQGVDLLPVLGGAAGISFATEYIAFRRVYEKLKGVPEKIFTDPANAPVPSEANILYALTGVLRHRANKKNLGVIYEYSKRLPKEFQTLLFRDIADKGKDENGKQKPGTEDLTDCAAYAKYIAENGAELVNAIA